MSNVTIAAELTDIRAQLAQGRVNTAQEAAEVLGQHAPLSPELLLLRAECALACGQGEIALYLLDRGLSLQDNAELWAAKGRALEALGDMLRAISCYQRSDALSDGTIGPYTASALRRVGRPQLALDAASQTENWLECAASAMDLGNVDLAISWFTRAGLKQRGAIELLLEWDRAQLPVEQIKSDIAQVPFHHFHSLDQIAFAQLLPDSRHKEVFDFLQTRLRSGTAIEMIECYHGLANIYLARGETKRADVHFEAAHEISASRKRPDHVLAEWKAMRALRLPTPRMSKNSVMPIFLSGGTLAQQVAIAKVLSQQGDLSIPRPFPAIQSVIKPVIRQVCASQIEQLSFEDMSQISLDLRRGLVDSSNGDEVVIATGSISVVGLRLVAHALPEAKFIHLRTPSQAACDALLQTPPCMGALASPQQVDTYAQIATELADQAAAAMPTQVISITASSVENISGEQKRALLEFVGILPTTFHPMTVSW